MVIPVKGSTPKYQPWSTGLACQAAPADGRAVRDRRGLWRRRGTCMVQAHAKRGQLWLVASCPPGSSMHMCQLCMPCTHQTSWPPRGRSCRSAAGCRAWDRPTSLRHSGGSGHERMAQKAPAAGCAQAAPIAHSTAPLQCSSSHAMQATDAACTTPDKPPPHQRSPRHRAGGRASRSAGRQGRCCRHSSGPAGPAPCRSGMRSGLRA